MMKLFKNLVGLFLISGFCSITVIAQPLNGIYSIDSGQPTGGMNFQSLNAFAASLSTNGVSGHVTAMIATGSGPYVGPVVFNTIPGAGANAIVTLEGNSIPVSAVTTTTDRHVVRLSNVQYMTINNLRINYDPTSTGGFYGIHIFNTGNHITISNCDIDLTNTTSTLYGGIVASGSEMSILTTGDFHNINIIGNTSTGGGYGASIFGLVSNLASNILIEGNNFIDFHSNGVYLRETNGAIIRSNHFNKRTPNVTSVNAIQIAQAANINAQIYANNIEVGQNANGTQTFRGIYLFNGTGHKVYNNVIHNIYLTSGNVTGIEVRTGATAPEISFNTIAIDNVLSTSGNLYGIREELSNTNSILRNNMISISQTTTGNKAALVLGATATVTSAFNSNYNAFWVPAGNIAIRNATTPTFYPTLASWQSASTQDAATFNVDPMFMSIISPSPTNPVLDNTGIAIAGITTDFWGITRGSLPDIGAYEWSAVGASESPNELSFSIYPNPAIHDLTIDLKGSTIKYLSFRILDITGREVMSSTIKNPNEKIQIDLSELKPSIYNLNLISGDRFETKRFIKR